MRKFLERWGEVAGGVRRTIGYGSMGLLVWGLAGCGSGGGLGEESGGRYPYGVTTTVGMITDIVRQVGGEWVEVTGIIGEGVDPHLYKPTSHDVKQLQGADVVFYNGLMLEGKMADILERVARSGKPVHAVTETISEDGDYLMSNAQNHHDPHVWMDVGGWMHAVEVVAASLSSYDPEHGSAYRRKAEQYLLRLRELDAYAREVIVTIPPDQRVLITAHDAFHYMARAYGLEVRGIQGISTESEAGVKDIENLIDFIVARNIPAVFVETSVSDKNVRALIEGARARGMEVRIGGKLFSDAMGSSGTYEGTYIGMIDHNVTTIVRALGGQAPERGMQGKLNPIP